MSKTVTQEKPRCKYRLELVSYTPAKYRAAAEKQLGILTADAAISTLIWTDDEKNCILHKLMCKWPLVKVCELYELFEESPESALPVLAEVLALYTGCAISDALGHDIKLNHKAKLEIVRAVEA